MISYKVSTSASLLELEHVSVVLTTNPINTFLQIESLAFLFALLNNDKKLTNHVRSLLLCNSFLE